MNGQSISGGGLRHLRQANVGNCAKHAGWKLRQIGVEHGGIAAAPDGVPERQFGIRRLNGCV